MFRRVVFVGAILLAGCGSESNSQPQSGASIPPGSEAGGGTIAAKALLDTTNVAKVALKVTQLIDTPVSVFDPATESSTPVACAVDADCAAYAGAACKSLLCTTTSSVSSIFYVKNQSGANLNDPVKVPCDGRTYTAEVYGSSSTAASPGAIGELWTSTPFTMSTGCEAAPSVTWTALNPPSLVFPTIYVGLPAPRDQYTVGVQGLAYPWSSTNWSLAQGSVNPVRYAGANATLAAPATNGVLDFTGKFHLDGSLLVSGETAVSWELAVIGSKTPVPSGVTPLP